MTAYFFDSSAIVKRYLNEVGSSWVTSLADLAAGNDVYLARIAFVEVISAITRNHAVLDLLRPEQPKRSQISGLTL